MDEKMITETLTADEFLKKIEDEISASNLDPLQQKASIFFEGQYTYGHRVVQQSRRLIG